MSDEGNREPSAGLAAAPPPGPGALVDPAVLEGYVRAALHRDRQPGALLAICHPLRMYKVPRGLLDALRDAGFEVEVVETLADRVQSVTQIRDAMLRLAETERPLDVVVFSGDGSLDHHVLVAAFWAFYPDLVRYREGEVTIESPTPIELAALPAAYRSAYVEPLPDGDGLEPDEPTIFKIWALRRRIGGGLDRERAPWRIARRAGLPKGDRLLKLAAFAALLPHRARLRAHGFDLSGLAATTQEHTFQGLYPFIRSISVYPAGTAADNALYAGVPSWTYAQASRVLTKIPWLDGLRRWWEERSTRRFVDFFTRGVVVPARFSVVALDGDWQVISSHAAGGPGGGRFFAADLESKTGGLLGYLARIPEVVVTEGLLGATRVRVRAKGVDGETKVATEARLVEGLYTNRAFIAGVGSVPSTNPTSFAGQSSLVLGPPIVYRDDSDRLTVNFSGLFSFFEAIGKGVLGRGLHLLGIGAGRLAGGGRFAFAAPEHQITLTEGEAVEMAFFDLKRRPRFVPTQVSGDPFQTATMNIRVAWGPLPMLAAPDSLLLAAAQRALTRLRHLQSWNLQTVYIGGVPFFRHRVGPARIAESGLLGPPLTLPWRLDRAQSQLLSRWSRQHSSEFVDTTEQGVSLGRNGRQAHTSDQTAHLVILRERGSLLVRQVRRDLDSPLIFEARTTYRSGWGGWLIHNHEVRCWDGQDAPRILQEEHYFQDADGFLLEAPGFFPFIGQDPAEPTWRDVTEEVELEPPKKLPESDAQT